MRSNRVNRNPAEPPVAILLAEEQVPPGLPAARHPNSALFMVQLSAFKQAALATGGEVITC